MHTLHHQHLVPRYRVAIATLVVVTGTDDFGGVGGAYDVNNAVVDVWMVLLLKANPHGGIQRQHIPDR